MRRFAVIVLLLTVLVLPACNIISRPDRPTGPDTGRVGDRLTFRTEGWASFHDYFWDMGDGTGEHDDDERIRYIYKKPGTYNITVWEACPLGAIFYSDESKPKTVTITEAP